MTTTSGRRAFLGTIAAAPLASIPLISRAKTAEHVFKLAHPLAADHPTNIRLQQAADRIAKQSDGRIQLRLFPNNQLGGEVDLLNQVRSGAVEMFVVGGLIASSVVPMAALDGVGFAFKDSAAVMKGMDGALGALIRSALMRANLYAPSVIWDYGFREITSSSRVIKTVADISGMKIRVPGAAAYVDLFKALGAAPTSIQFNEVYPALQTKIVDGQENPLGVIVTSKFYEVQSFCALSNHIWQGNWVLINGRAWRGLSADLQQIMEKNLNESGLAQRQDLAKLEQSYKDTIMKGGVKINDIDAGSFRKKLTATGYYKNAREKFGDAAWKVLEQAAGRELA